MKRYILFLSTLLMYGILHSQINGTVKWKQGVDFSIEKGYEYVELISETHYYIEEVGNPKIPYCVKSFVVPRNAVISNIQVSVINKQLIGGSLLLIPAQYPIPVGEYTPSWVEPNDKVYNSTVPFPGKYVEVLSDREDFGYHIVTVKFYPIEYIPKNREVYLCDLSFSLEYSINQSAPSLPISDNRSERLNVLNKEYVKSIVDNKGMLVTVQNTSLQASDMGTAQLEYLIITNESLKNSFQPLADWKTKKGVPAMIETVENIVKSYKGADTQEKIRNYLGIIKQKYGSLFVLLGGDINIIPARLKKSRHSDGPTLVGVDYYYACAAQGTWAVRGDSTFVENLSSSDFGLSFNLGRASVENQIEATIFVNKVINYEKCIGITDARYYNNTLVADAFTGNGKCNPYLLYDNGKEKLIGYYDKYKKRFSNAKSWFMYDDYWGTDSLRCVYDKLIWVVCHVDPVTKKTKSDPVPGGTCLPGDEELTTANFLNALNNGGNSTYGPFHIVYHMDHSSPNALGASSLMKGESINKSDVDKLQNGKYTQIVMSGGCTPADITKDCVAEHFLNNPNGGAVAFIGNMDVGYTSEYLQFDNFCKELYKTSSSTNRYDLSYLQIKANGYLHSGNCALHLFGDPEMQVWTETPRNLNVTITPGSVKNGDTNITVNISNLPNSQKAMVCLQKGDEVYTVESMGNGNRIFAVSPQTTGNINVTITSHNFRPYETTIPVGVSPNAVLHVLQTSFKDDKTGKSNGNNDKLLDAGETVELLVALKNSGNMASGSVVSARLFCDAPEINLLNNTILFNKINPQATASANDKFVFTIDKNCEERSKNSLNPVTFTLAITNGATTTSEQFQVDIHAPEIQAGNQAITWTSNGNTTIEAGEQVKMNIDLTNNGSAKATGLKATLISNNAQSISQTATIGYPDIAPSETKTNSAAFIFRVSNSYTGDLNFTLKLTNAYGKTWSFPVNPLSRPATINKTTISSKPFESSINVYWTPISNIAGYNIYRSDNGEYGTYRKLNKFLLTAAYFLDENLTGRTTYHYKITAVSTNGNESNLSVAYKAWTSYPAVSPFPRQLPVGNYTSESCPIIADVDNDGKQEIFWLCDDRKRTKDSYIMGFRANGEELYDIDNNVTTISGFARTPVMVKGQAAIGDLKGNGEQNIVVSSWDDSADAKPRHRVFCYSAFDKNGDKRPDLLWETKIPFSMNQTPVIANLDGSADGTMEVLIKSHHTPDIYILDCNGQEIRRLNPNVTNNKDRNYSGLSVADLDNDGQMEIIASYDSLGIYIWRHTGEPFKTNPFWGTKIAKLASTPVVCDLDGDGKKDILFSQRGINTSHIYAITAEGNRVPGWNDSQTIPYTIDGTLDHTLSVGDINNDGHPEVVILGHNVIKVWKHTGALLWQKEIPGLFRDRPYAGNVNTPILADVDGDAIPDIVFCSEKLIYALHNDGSDITGFPIMSDEEFKDTPCVSDIDNDGKNELIAGDKNNLYVWRTDGVPGAIEWGIKRGNAHNTVEYSSGICEPMVINGNQTWNGESPCSNIVIQSGKFIIPTGRTMTLKNASAIIVRSGATLEVDGATISGASIKAQAGSKIIIKNNGRILIGHNSVLQIEKGALMDYQYGKVDVTKR